MLTAHRLLQQGAQWLASDDLQKVVLGILGWFGHALTAWWRGRERYQAHVTWHYVGTMRGKEEMPVLIVQSVHPLPINVTGVRIRNALRWRVDEWAFDSDDEEYPSLPYTIEPMKSTMLILNEHALKRVAKQWRLLGWIGLPRVYVGVQTMGRGERIFVAERGLPYDFRLSRYRR